MLSQPMTQFAVFLFEAREPQSVFDGHKQLIRREWFFQKVERAEFGGLHGHFNICLA
jgi:hypothetical protein